MSYIASKNGILSDFISELCALGTDKKADMHMGLVRTKYAELYGDVVPLADAQIIELSQAVKYLAKLRFFADGDARSRDVLSSFTVEESTLSFDAKAESRIPKTLADFLKLYRPYSFELEQHDNGDVVAHVTIPDAVIRAYPVSAWNAEKVVALLCFEVFNGIALSVRTSSASPYEIRNLDGIPEWRIRTANTFIPDIITAAMDAIVVGVVRPCVYCGAPVFLSTTNGGVVRKNAKPYCSNNHKNIGSKAKQLLKKEGRTVDEVMAKYPQFLRSTIEEWSRDLEVK